MYEGVSQAVRVLGQFPFACPPEGDYQGSVSALERGYVCATKVPYPELQVSCDSYNLLCK
ncbi:hypothetical protein MTR_4g023640 [Medicago truncatula]|uniref:Uncharacterized protein n=1 Tax=Medicago truncatula TaxID=3880 RepID=A0A072UI04_MEDTR|nr:hypothetical protein MTR_4g023640 [Medicago truncatula]